MWFRFLLFRLSVLAFFCSLPFLMWPPPTWVVVFCAIMAGGIAAFGLLDPKSRILRLIVTAVIAFLPLLGGTLGPDISEAMVPNDGVRDWLNFALDWFTADGGTSLWVLSVYILIVLALIALEIWRSYLESQKDSDALRLRPISGTKLWWLNPIGRVFTLEAKIVATNQKYHEIDFATAELSLWGLIGIEATLSPVQEGVFPLSPDERLTIPANGEIKFHILGEISSSDPQGSLLCWLSNWVGRYLIPVPAKISIADVDIWINLWAGPQPEDRTSKSTPGDLAPP